MIVWSTLETNHYMNSAHLGGGFETPKVAEEKRACLCMCLPQGQLGEQRGGDAISRCMTSQLHTSYNADSNRSLHDQGVYHTASSHLGGSAQQHKRQVASLLAQTHPLLPHSLKERACVERWLGLFILSHFAPLSTKLFCSLAWFPLAQELHSPSLPTLLAIPSPANTSLHTTCRTG